MRATRRVLSQRLQPLRCPFCHEAVDVEADHLLACAACQARHHADCWDELGTCATCSGVEARGRYGLVRPAPSARIASLAGENEPGPGSSLARRSVVSLIFAVTLFSVGYRLLAGGGLSHTSALFVGLPALLAVALALTPRARSLPGMAVKGTTLALLISGIVLGEGTICVLMAAPIFYGVAIFSSLMIMLAQKLLLDGVGSSKKSVCLALPLLVALSLEGVAPPFTFERAETVSATRDLPAPPEDVERALARPPAFDRPLPRFLGLGFPEPTEATGSGLEVGDTRRVSMSGGGEGEGELVLVVVTRDPGHVRFRVQSDTTPVSKWLRWREADVRWEPLPGGGTRVNWTLRYERLLDPVWYFGPLERLGAEQAAGYLIDSLEVRP